MLNPLCDQPVVATPGGPRLGPRLLGHQLAALTGQDGLGRRVGDALAEQPLGQARLALQQVPGLGPRPLADEVRRLVLQPLLGPPPALAGAPRRRPPAPTDRRRPSPR